MGDVQSVDVLEAPVWSHSCLLEELVLSYALPGRATECLDLGPGWPRTWTVTWKAGTSEVVVPVGDLWWDTLVGTKWLPFLQPTAR
ncbi:hypothetical protein ACH4C6_36070 [Streptomyces sp. NPDC017943]|uniref:hypothetical protein n=1 Tax=Streptomyces sp. NPDC017943 TaxID=3365019 RepID=UPI00379C0D72